MFDAKSLIEIYKNLENESNIHLSNNKNLDLFNAINYTKDYNPKIHSGIGKYFEKLSLIITNSLSKQIFRLQNKGYKIESFFLTGHSLGGALASIYSLNIKHLFNTETHLISFSSPKFALDKSNKLFYIDSLKLKSFYFIYNDSDIVINNPIDIELNKKTNLWLNWKHIYENDKLTNNINYNSINTKDDTKDTLNKIYKNNLNNFTKKYSFLSFYAEQIIKTNLIKNYHSIYVFPNNINIYRI
jgi:hypothetical protein